MHPATADSSTDSTPRVWSRQRPYNEADIAELYIVSTEETPDVRILLAALDAFEAPVPATDQPAR